MIAPITNVSAPRPIRAAAALALGIIWGVQPGSAAATTEDEAQQLCVTEMTGPQSATEVRATETVQHDRRWWVYGDADFDDAAAVHFSCIVHEDKVVAVRYLVPDTSRASGKRWSSERPHGTEHEGLELDEAAKLDVSLPPAEAKVMGAPKPGSTAPVLGGKQPGAEGTTSGPAFKKAK